ncbi:MULTISPECIES: hypothetical protein [unclassified Burkholderia]|uniref:hypothetical protein n=1 Tax=unclassified Burkholderia TaxID=2613784 RepID=UPI000AA17880|nr:MULTISPECIES: hypothetical protein [unclassified Burkholderia]
MIVSRLAAYLRGYHSRVVIASPRTLRPPFRFSHFATHLRKVNNTDRCFARSAKMMQQDPQAARDRLRYLMRLGNGARVIAVKKNINELELTAL